MSEEANADYRPARRASAPQTAEEAPIKKRHPVRRAIITILVILLAIVLGYGGYYWFRVNSAMETVQREETMMPTVAPESRAPAPTRAPEAKHDPKTYVLMGSDTRGDDQGRSDTLMVAYLSGDRNHVYLISFPRDMWVPIPGYGDAKINAAHAFGGPALTIQTLEEMLDTRMDHAVGIDFEGFIELTTALGGVTVINKYESSVGEYYFPKGEITISGDEALAYVRQREGLPNGDLDRAERQRDVLGAIIDKLTAPEVLANPARMGAVLDQVASTVTVDQGLSNSEIYSTAGQLGFSGLSGVRSLQAPIVGFGTSADGQAIDVVDWQKMDELAKAMQTDSMADYYARNVG